MSQASRITEVIQAVANLIKGRQPLSTTLTDLSGRTVGAGESNSILDRASGDSRYNTFKGILAGHPGKPTASLVLGGGTIMPYGFTINQATSVALAKTAATSSTVFTILRNGTQIGTITFGAGATAGTFSFSQTSITQDQRVDIVAPATPDATLADLAIRIPA